MCVRGRKRQMGQEMIEQMRKRRQGEMEGVLHLSPNLIKNGRFPGLAEEKGGEEDEKFVKQRRR